MQAYSNIPRHNPTLIKKSLKTYTKSLNLKITAYPKHTTIYLYITLYISTHYSALSPPHSALSTGKLFSSYISTLRFYHPYYGHAV